MIFMEPDARRFHQAQQNPTQETQGTHHDDPGTGGNRQLMQEANHHPRGRSGPLRLARRLYGALLAPPDHAPGASEGPEAGAITSRESLETTVARYVSFATLAALSVCVALSVGAQEAFAQAPPGGGGGGDAIESTLTNIRNYLAGLSFAIGGIGFVASLLVKGYASINENAHAYAAMGMKGSLWCIIAGVIVTPILTIAAGLAGGGGG